MLTTFQRRHLEKLSHQTNFNHFCDRYLEDDFPKERALTVLYYTTDGKLNLVRLGKKRVMSVLVA